MAGSRKLEGEHLQRSLQMLQNVAEVFDAHGLPYWLEGGTLLGVIREQRLLPWDTDIDLSIRAEDYLRLAACLPALRRRGLRLRLRSFDQDDAPFSSGAPRLLKIRSRHFFFFRGHVLIDVFVKYRQDDRYHWIIGRKKPTRKSAPARFYDELAHVQFNGRTYPVPGDAEGYLEFRYGDWRTPVTEWNTFRDDLAVKN